MRAMKLLSALAFSNITRAQSTKFFGHTIPVSRGGFDFTLRQPLGVVAAIVPWNFPFPIACWKVAPALAAGNCVVLKPASLSPLTALMLGEIAAAAGLPAGVLQVVPGSGSNVGDALVTHPLVRKISFTGSTEIGRRIMELAAQGIKRISLELGGKSPNIVFADADLEQAAAQSPEQRLRQHRPGLLRPQPHLRRATASSKNLPNDSSRRRANSSSIIPRRIARSLAPWFQPANASSVEEFIHSARNDGRTIAFGGERVFDQGAYLQPTVICEPDVTDRVWREEVFGPVACIRPFDNEER